MTPRLHKAKHNDGISIVINFFDFLSYIYQRNMHPQEEGSTLYHAIHLCNRFRKPAGIDVDRLIR